MKLTIKNLHAKIADTEQSILNGINLEVEQGSIHALMGPNGSGKSTLGNSLMGHPAYEVTKGKVTIGNHDLLELEPNERASAGLFLAFQHPITIPGVPLANFLRAAYEQLHGEETTTPQGITEKKTGRSALDFFSELKGLAKELQVPEDFLRRPINDGLSGGERKKIETLQILALKPKFIILDELDTGTDVDTLKRIGETINSLRDREDYHPAPGILMITHYNRIFNYVKPDHVHVIKKGKIVKSGDAKLVDKIESSGYDQF